MALLCVCSALLRFSAPAQLRMRRGRAWQHARARSHCHTTTTTALLHRLQVPEGYAHARAPIHLAGAVTTGFGRGSRQLGVPTANLPPGELQEQLEGLPAGVYFG